MFLNKKLENCFQNGLLKKTRKEPKFATQSLERAKKILLEIPELLSLELNENAVQRIYQATFHAVKALLYRDGIKEKSHFCVSAYFQETYKEKFPSDLLTLLERLRDIRHETQYGLEEPSIEKELLDQWLTELKQLMKHIEQLLKERD